jgi:transcription initiation factor TFIIF subunit alpha
VGPIGRIFGWDRSIEAEMSSNPLKAKQRTVTNPLRRANPSPLVKREPGTPKTRPTSSNSATTPAIKREPDDEGPGANYTDFKLRACKLEEVKDTRHHILKFHSKAPINPTTDFTPPIRFHRKDPRNLQFQLTLSEMQQQSESPNEAETSAPRPTADMSVVAPDGGARKQARPFQKKTRQVISGNQTSRKLRYEEYYPWIMEDFDGKNTWVGNYEAAQSDAYVLFVFDSDGFKMVPADKWYKMTPRNKFATLTLEEAEQRMEKKSNVPRWIMKHIAEEQGQQQTPVNERRRFRTVDGAEISTKRRDEDHDEIDYDEEFADDEEAPIMDGDEEDLKAVEDKIKKEQRTASHIVSRMEDNEEEEVTGEPKIDKEGKKLKKYLRSLEKNAYYESDEEANPYASSEAESEDEEVATETPKIKQEETDRTSPPLPQKITKRKPKRDYKNLAPGMVILQLQPQVLGSFTRNLWNANAKRRREDSDGDAAVKKIKLQSPSPPTTVSSDEDLLTEQDVRTVITSKRVTLKELLKILRPKLSKHSSNPERLKQFLKEVARLHEGVLVPKESSPAL